MKTNTLQNRNTHIYANNPQLKSWIEVNDGSDFPIQNLPFGVIQKADGETVCASRIGDTAINLSAFYQLGYFDGLQIRTDVFAHSSLNAFIELGQEKWRAVRNRLTEVFEENSPNLEGNSRHRSQILSSVEEIKMVLPVQIGDYTDFYSSLEHATNVGIMFRGKENALMPNWKHIPVGYHGRSSSIVVSKACIHRPKGQLLPTDQNQPVFGASRLMDFELEMAFITGKKSGLGEPIPIDTAEEHIFGLVLFNDLSARDIQKWEYIPLGPFLGKSFGSVISPWIVTLDALEPFRTRGPEQNPEVFPYLQYEGEKNYDLNLEVYIQPENEEESQVCSSNYKYMYWNMCQQLAHQTVNGCNINVGDLYASGTISGPTPNSYGSMLELSWKGTKPVKLKNKQERKFLHDKDTVIMRGYGLKDGLRIGLGECRVTILPARD
jgi:fumarylacetoacetase